MSNSEELIEYADNLLKDRTLSVRMQIVKMMEKVARSYRDMVDEDDNDWNYANREHWTKEKFIWAVLCDMWDEAQDGDYDRLDNFEDAFTCFPSCLGYWDTDIKAKTHR